MGLHATILLKESSKELRLNNNNNNKNNMCMLHAQGMVKKQVQFGPKMLISECFKGYHTILNH
jgi:hypothetical protein